MWSEQLWHVPRPRVFLSNPVNTPALILECPPLVLLVGVSSSFPPPAIPSPEFYVFFFFFLAPFAFLIEMTKMVSLYTN